MIGLAFFNFIFILGCVALIYHFNRTGKINLGKAQNINAMSIIKRMSENNNDMNISINQKIDINNQLKIQVDILAKQFIDDEVEEAGNVRVLAKRRRV
jgi:hypothetical protein